MSLAERTKALTQRLSTFPEAGKRGDDTVLKPDAWLALLDLRQMLEREIIPKLYELERDTVEVPRLDMGKPGPRGGLAGDSTGLASRFEQW